MTTLIQNRTSFICSNCGNTNWPDSLKCVQCGQKFENKKIEKNPQREPSNTNTLISKPTEEHNSKRAGKKTPTAVSEIGTLIFELNENIGGKSQFIAGVTVGLLGIFTTLFGLAENHRGLVFFGIVVGGFGIMISYLGRQKVRKAEFISWVLHALALYDKSKENDKS